MSSSGRLRCRPRSHRTVPTRLPAAPPRQIRRTPPAPENQAAAKNLRNASEVGRDRGHLPLLPDPKQREGKPSALPGFKTSEGASSGPVGLEVKPRSRIPQVSSRLVPKRRSVRAASPRRLFGNVSPGVTPPRLLPGISMCGSQSCPFDPVPPYLTSPVFPLIQRNASGGSVIFGGSFSYAGLPVRG